MNNLTLHDNVAKKIFTVLPDTKIFDAYKFMIEKRVRHLLVVDIDNIVVGMISDRDFQRALVTNIEKTDHLKIIAEHFNPEDDVQDYMNWQVARLPEEASLKQVAYKILEEKISSVIIVNSSNKVIGILTTDDLIWVLIKLLDEKEHSFLEELKSGLINSPLGALANSLSQSGI
jgi:acetoin utilization protein AcuB